MAAEHNIAAAAEREVSSSADVTPLLPACFENILFPLFDKNQAHAAAQPLELRCEPQLCYHMEAAVCAATPISRANSIGGSIQYHLQATFYLDQCNESFPDVIYEAYKFSVGTLCFLTHLLIQAQPIRKPSNQKLHPRN